MNNKNLLIKQIDECKAKKAMLQEELERLYDTRHSLMVSRSNLCAGVDTLDIAHMDMFIILNRNINDLSKCIAAVRDDIEKADIRRHRLYNQLISLDRCEYFRPMDLIDIKLVIDDIGSIRGHKL